MLEIITEEVDRYQQCWMTHFLMLIIQFAPRWGIYFNLKITITFIYGIFKKLIRLHHYQFSYFFERFSVYQVGLMSE